MCRHNQLYGCVLIAAGVGILAGMWLEMSFLSYCIAIGLAILGIGLVRR